MGGSGGFRGGGCGCCLVGLAGVGLVDFFSFSFCCGCGGGGGGGGGCVCGCDGCLYWLCVMDILFYYSGYII